MTARFIKFGFTLIEILEVISIIGILATLVAVNLNAARSRARDAQRKSDIKNISTALRLYYNDAGKYPDPLISPFPFGSIWKVGTTVYMELVPQDPLYDSQCYKYVRPDSDTYTLQACLENASDKQGKSPTVTPGCTCSSNWVFEVK